MHIMRFIYFFSICHILMLQLVHAIAINAVEGEDYRVMMRRGGKAR